MDQSRAECVFFQILSARRTVDLKTLRVYLNQGLDLEVRFESHTVQFIFDYNSRVSGSIFTHRQRRSYTKIFGVAMLSSTNRCTKGTDWRALKAGIPGYAFWRISKATERSFLHLYAHDLRSSNSVSCHICGG